MRAARAASHVAAPLLLGVLALAAWEWLVLAADLKPYLLPSPTAIGTELVASGRLVLDDTLSTGWNVLLGLLVGAVAGVAVALAAARSRLLDGLVSPLAAAAAVMPIVALAPVLNNMFGSTTEVSRQIIVSVVAFAPVFFNTLKGLRQVRPVHRDIMRAYAATGWQLARTVTLPGAVPYMFTGLRLASAVGVIAAVVAEYFGGRQNGLGSAITSAAAASAYPRAWAYVVGAIVLGLVFYCVTLLLERLVARRMGGAVT